MLKVFLLVHYSSLSLMKLRYKIFYKLCFECNILFFFVILVYYIDLVLKMIISKGWFNWRWFYCLKCFFYWQNICNLGQNRNWLLTIRLNLNQSFAYWDSMKDVGFVKSFFMDSFAKRSINSNKEVCESKSLILSFWSCWFSRNIYTFYSREFNFVNKQKSILRKNTYSQRLLW